MQLNISFAFLSHVRNQDLNRVTVGLSQTVLLTVPFVPIILDVCCIAEQLRNLQQTITKLQRNA